MDNNIFIITTPKVLKSYLR